MEKIAVFGGTFNPIHLGHVNLCLECRRRMGFDRMILVPANIPPHKEVEDLVPGEHRLAMCRLATEGFAGFEVSDIEFRLSGISYTFHTLERLRSQYPEAELFLLIGSDMLYMFDQWYRYKDILSMATLVAGARYEQEYEQMCEYKSCLGRAGRNISIIRFEVKMVSSTQIREALAGGEDLDGLLDSRVVTYIREHKLYGRGEKNLDGTED